MKIDMGEGLRLPADEAATQTYAMLGIRGSGKTYTAGKLVEELIRAKARVVVVDPVGVWWGLRVAADGVGEGIPIPILGGDHGDLALSVQGGAEVARFIATNRSAVLDVSLFRKHERTRFVTDFCEELFHQQKRTRDPLHIAIEEAHVFMPEGRQGGRSEESRGVGAWEDLVRIGRNYGIGVSMISQRPQAIAKAMLNQAEVLFLHQLVGAQERAAIKAWVVENADQDKGVLDQLPHLERGTAIVWSPRWLKFLASVKIGQKWTYDGSSTPTKRGGRIAETKPLDAQDRAGLEAAMKETAAEARASDAGALASELEELRRVASNLESEIADLRRDRDAVAAENQRLREQVLDAQPVLAALDEAGVALGKAREGLQKVGQLNGAAWSVDFSRPVVHEASVPPRLQPPAAIPGVRHGVARNPDAAPAEGAKPVHLRVLQSVRWWEMMGVARPTVAQVAFAAKMAPGGGSFKNTLGRCSTSGWVERQDGLVILTPEGRAMTTAPAKHSLTVAALHEQARDILRQGKGTGPMHVRILDVLLARRTTPMSVADLAAQTGYEPGGGSFKNALGRLSTLGLVKRSSGQISSSALLFPPGR